MWEQLQTLFEINPETGLVAITWPIVVLLIAAGFAVGVVNTFAGSGSVITYSLFMLLGLPANVANGTIRFGVIMQTLAASSTFWKGGKLPVKKGVVLSIPVIVGTLLGAQIATQINQEVFKKVLGVVMLLMLFFIFYDPQKWLIEQAEKTQNKLNWKQILLFFAVGTYGGFIHIGVGIFLLVTLVLNTGYELVKANALKVFVVFLYSPFALAVFIFHGQVDYRLGLISAIGNVIGGIVASRMALQRGAHFIRWFLVVIIVLFTARLFLV